MMCGVRRTTLVATAIMCLWSIDGRVGTKKAEAKPGAAHEQSRRMEGARNVNLGPTIQATNAFYYYADVEGAWAFYTEVLGLETVVDYGFAKILRVAPASYLTLVDAERGMHSADEPKTVTLAIVTEHVEAWYDYLTSQDVPMRAELSTAEGRPHDGFVAVDPEGYYLEFERFNPHPENGNLTPILEAIEPLAGAAGSRPEALTIQATVLWLYYRELAPMQEFYERLLRAELLVDQGWAKVYQVSGTGFVGLVDGRRGLHDATDQKSVTVSFFTDDVDGWFDRVQAMRVELRTPEVTAESGRVRVFVAYDAEGYYLEWDTFLPVPSNAELLRLLEGPQPNPAAPRHSAPQCSCALPDPSPRSS